MAFVAGIGFTVSLLVGVPVHGGDPAKEALVNVAVLTGSLPAALIGAVLLRTSQGRAVGRPDTSSLATGGRLPGAERGTR